MTETLDDNPRSLIPIRIELSSPDTDWPRTWSLTKQRPLGPLLTSFLFKMLHNILPTGDREARILPAASPNCTRSTQDPPVLETLYHYLFTFPTKQRSLNLSNYLSIPILPKYHTTKSTNFKLTSRNLLGTTSHLGFCIFLILAMIIKNRKESCNTIQNKK